jgi:hypothetical protein
MGDIMHNLTAPKITWTDLASHLIGECFDLVKPYLDQDCERLDPEVRFISTQLFIDCHLSSESVLLLVRANKEWDAEMIARSVVEGTLKYCYILVGTADQAKSRSIEFWDILPSFAEARRSERAKQILDWVSDPENDCWQPLRDIVLTDAEIAELRDGTNRHARKELEERWSFAGIMRHFATSHLPEWKCISMLAHGYGNSSHLIHKDGIGVGMVWDRYQRDPDRQAAVTLAHAARLISDVCAFCELRTFTLLRACGLSSDAALEIREQYSTLWEQLHAANELFTQIEYGGLASDPKI